MSFSVDLSRLVKKAKGQQEAAVRKVAIETFSRVVMKSPVDTGRFRGNWVAAIGAYSGVTTTDVDPSGRGTVGKIAAAVAGMPINGASIFLTNSLPYSIRLEYGYSRQAPAGMVRTTLAEISTHYGRKK